MLSVLAVLGLVWAAVIASLWIVVGALALAGRIADSFTLEARGRRIARRYVRRSPAPLFAAADRRAM